MFLPQHDHLAIFPSGVTLPWRPGCLAGAPPGDWRVGVDSEDLYRVVSYQVALQEQYSPGKEMDPLLS